MSEVACHLMHSLVAWIRPRVYNRQKSIDRTVHVCRTTVATL